MGSQFCKNIQTNKNQITTIKKQPNCLKNFCNQNLTTEQPYHQHLQPIQFSQMNSIQSTPQKTKYVGQARTQNKLNQQYLNTQSQINEETAAKQNFNKLYVKSKLNIEENQPKSASIQFIQVNRNKQGRIDKIEGNDNYLRIQVPYSVIKLTIKPKILKQFNNIGEDFQKQHEKIISETYMNWKLHKNGCYVNKITDGTIMIMTSNCYFRGNTKSDSFIAQGPGVLVTEFFNYKGDFKQGKAEGKGVYKNANQTISCSGFWKNGQMYKGKLTHPHYLYDGEFKNSVPNGKGILKIFNKKVKYDGKFVNGFFHDQQGKYECPEYFYIGGFEKGKKQGKGIFTRHLKINNRTSVNIQKLKKGQQVSFKNDKLQKQ